jgi:hypothetical protein
MFSLSSPDRIRELLVGAGFELLSLDEVALEWEYDSFDGYWLEEALVAGPYADHLTGLTSPDRDALMDVLERLLLPYRQPGGGYRVPGLTNVAIART